MAFKITKIEHADLEKIRKVINHYGVIPQKNMVVEEMSELTKEIMKSHRGVDNRDLIADEMADVFLTMKQLQIIYNIPDYIIEESIDVKLKRTVERIDNLC